MEVTPFARYLEPQTKVARLILLHSLYNLYIGSKDHSAFEGFSEISKSDADEKARQKRRQAKIERNRRKRKKKLANRLKAHGTKIKKKKSARGGERKEERHGRSILNYYRDQVSPSIRLPTRLFTNSVSFPSTFSFIEDPEKALQTIDRVIETCFRRRGGEVILDQRQCEVIDYGAQSVISVLIKSAAHALRNHVTAHFPEDDLLKKTVFATGLPREIGIPTPSDFVHLPLCHGRKGKEAGHKTTSRETATRDFVAHIDKCLFCHGWKLTRDGKRYLGGLVTEVIGNAEDHSGRDDWWIGGYMYMPEGAERGACYFTVFNLGRPISESLSDLPQDSRLNQDIENLIQKHISRFAPGRKQGREQLHTLYALQEGVTRFNRKPDMLETDRGQGTVDMITHFQHLGQTLKDGVEPKMCLVSGSSYILFDEKYKMQEEEKNGGKRRVIAFNSGNNLKDPPDHRNVKGLSRYFPGTLISGRFYLDPEHLDRENRDHE